MLKGLQMDIKFLWIPSHCSIVANKTAEYPAKKGIKISQTSACKLRFHSATLREKLAFKLTYQHIMPFKANINPGII
jgi:hypothetical protein